MAKKKATKRASKKSAGARSRAKPAKGTPAPQDPIQAALARRRAALIGR
jgi:hypothetical protein